jgi:hypothetical protein
VLYKITTTAGDEFRNTELFTFAADRIRHIDVYFGTSYRDGVFAKQQCRCAAEAETVEAAAAARYGEP